MEGTFDNVRIQVSQYMFAMNEAGLNNSFAAISRADGYRQSLIDYIAEQSGSQTCLENVQSTFDEQYEENGAAMSQCSYEALNAMDASYTNLFNAIEAARKISTGVQNIVVESLGEWNPITSAEDLSYLIGLRIDALEATFIETTVPALTELLGAVAANVDDVPANILSCTTPVLATIQNQGEIGRVSARLC